MISTSTAQLNPAPPVPASLPGRTARGRYLDAEIASWLQSVASELPEQPLTMPVPVGEPQLMPARAPRGGSCATRGRRRRLVLACPA